MWVLFNYTFGKMNAKFATFSSRLQAVLADGFVFTVIMYLVNFIISPVFPKITDLKSTLFNIGLSIAIYIIVSTLYYLISWINFDGATIGKKLAGIKIVKTDGSSMTFGPAFARVIGYWVSTLGIGLGYLWVLWDKNKQGWHDKIAKTYVVETGATPKKKLLWTLIIGFLLLSSLNSTIGELTRPEVTLLNPDGTSTDSTDKITADSVVAVTIYEGKGTIKKGEYWGYGFEFYEKANLNIEIETNYNAHACVFSEVDFLKFQNGDESARCLYEVLASPVRTPLESGKYTFVVVPNDKAVNYSVSLKATNI